MQDARASQAQLIKNKKVNELMKISWAASHFGSDHLIGSCIFNSKKMESC